jgi:hypothetical protein
MPTEDRPGLSGLEAMLQKDYAPLVDRLNAPLGMPFSPRPVTRAERWHRRRREAVRRLARVWCVLRTGDDGRDCW